MARSLPPYTWKNGYAVPAGEGATAPWADEKHFSDETGERAHYRLPVEGEKLTSTVGNSFGIAQLRSWPDVYNGTEAGQEKPAWWKPETEVDVLICGAGPFGLEVAMNLARQGISFRIVDKAAAPCLSGRADGLQPRAVEYLQSWGVGHEAAEVGPLLDSTVLYRNGVKLFHDHSSTCDSRFKGIHIITQGQIEKIYIRDLLRHRALVERCTTVDSFQVDDEPATKSHPVTATLKNVQTGTTETVRARYLIGADGASSKIREKLEIPFDGLATDCFWAIMDCQFKTDFPYILGFCILISPEHGGCIVIPREDGHTRFYVQITGETAAKIAAARKNLKNGNRSTVGETQVHNHTITPEEALQHLNKIIAPWTVEFASAMSWFAVWRVNERVARSYSTPDQRVHIGGDAAHVHSVLGAFGLNSSIYDAANLGWKLGLSIKGHARAAAVLPTYDSERRLFANRVIRVSGAYLRFICNLNLPLAELRGLDAKIEVHDENMPALDGSADADLRFLYSFFGRNAKFLLGVEGPIVTSPICPPDNVVATGKASTTARPTSLLNGVRAPSPRVCFGASSTGYLYDGMTGVDRFHILVFASDLQGGVRGRVAQLARAGFGAGGFYERFGGCDRFNVLLVIKALPHEVVGEGSLLAAGPDEPELARLLDVATLVYDDRAPDEDAHYWYAVNHARGAIVVVRPDLVVGMSAWPEETAAVDKYFSGFLVETLPN
ncbi:FAD binding domain-containing protein [Lasiosphaeria ovina]|uniref:FAD binding domain-containing protein n=1 Tax=Lasiosphaeria ovina TaxID=92902 RepID=A0AAE0K4Z5_9PEZI|nr:FAD binding domain-containing protein [Lasiosphaeria ovina]